METMVSILGEAEIEALCPFFNNCINFLTKLHVHCQNLHIIQEAAFTRWQNYIFNNIPHNIKISVFCDTH
jgi:hypothetical protein